MKAKANRRAWIQGVTSIYRSPVSVFVCAILLVLFAPIKAYSQDTQIWFEVDGHKPLNKNWKYTGSPNLHTLTVDQGWSRIGLKNTFTRKVQAWFAAELGSDVFYTSNPVDTNIGELRLRVAGKVSLPKFIRAIHLQKPYCELRVEQRFLWYPEDDAEDQKTRLRLKAGGTFILNNDKLVEKTFYVPWYIEGFHNFNGAAFEYSAVSDRTSLGIGYVINPGWRAEFEFIAQGSRNTLERGLERTDNILQFKMHYFFDK